MGAKASLELRGRVKIALRRGGPGGPIVHQEEGDNLVVTNGKNRYAAILRSNDGSTQEPTHVGLGDDGTAVTAADTALGNEHAAPARAVITPSVSGNEVTYTTQHTNSTGGSLEVNEVGIFDQLAVGGQMFARYLTTGFTMNDTDVLDLVWTLTIG